MPARFDAPGAPHNALLAMRRSTAAFARDLADLRDTELQCCQTSRRILAEVSLQARGMALRARALRLPLTGEEATFAPDIPLTATLPVPALRHLFTHSALHLNVELRDLEDRHWTVLRDLPRQRTHTLRTHADLLKDAQSLRQAAQDQRRAQAGHVRGDAP